MTSEYWKDIWANLGKNKTFNPDQGLQGPQGPQGSQGPQGLPGESYDPNTPVDQLTMRASDNSLWVVTVTTDGTLDIVSAA